MTKMLEPIMLFVAVTHMPDTRDFIRPAYRGQGQSPSPPPHLPGIPQARHGVVWLVEARAVARRKQGPCLVRLPLLPVASLCPHSHTPLTFLVSSWRKTSVCTMMVWHGLLVVSVWEDECLCGLPCFLYAMVCFRVSLCHAYAMLVLCVASSESLALIEA